MAEIEAKTALDDVIHPTEKYPPHHKIWPNASPPKLLNHEISNGRRVITK
jgi:hypothetical protein